MPALVAKGERWTPEAVPDGHIGPDTYAIRRYRPRGEGLFARIERWVRRRDGDVHWRSTSRENVTTVYGADEKSRIANPAKPSQIFSWLISETHDDRGNAIFYEYKTDDLREVSRDDVSERHRMIAGTSAQQYLKRIKYGNIAPRRANEDLSARLDWLFEVGFDYGEHHATLPTTQEIGPWLVRQDPFSAYRSTFEVRSYRLCQRVQATSRP